MHTAASGRAGSTAAQWQSGIHRGPVAERNPPRPSGRAGSNAASRMCSSLGPIWAAGPCICDNALHQRSSPSPVDGRAAEPAAGLQPGREPGSGGRRKSAADLRDIPRVRGRAAEYN
ncbi:unnamed protein product [Boreogadus saida]